MECDSFRGDPKSPHEKTGRDLTAALRGGLTHGPDRGLAKETAAALAGRPKGGALADNVDTFRGQPPTRQTGGRGTRDPPGSVGDSTTGEREGQGDEDVVHQSVLVGVGKSEALVEGI